MKIMQLALAVCLLVSLGCDPSFTGLGTEPLTVSVTTIGANPDTDGYMLSITGEPEEPIGANEIKYFTVVRIPITAELSDVAANCAVRDNPQTVDVKGPTTVAFYVECV